MRKWLSVSLALGLIVLGACADDPYSARRIRLRQEHFNALAKDIADREATGPARIEAARQTVERKWWSDVERFNRRVPTVGDYVW